MEHRVNWQTGDRINSFLPANILIYGGGTIEK